MDEKAKQIIDSAAQTFMKFGIRSVTMDDVAKNAGISKKTLYQVVDDKSELVKKVLENLLQEDTECFLEIEQRKENAIDQVAEIYRESISRIGNIHPSVYFDLEKYYPEAFALITTHKYKTMYDCVSRNLNHGIEQGFYRDNIDVDIITKLYVAKMDMMFDGEVFPMQQYKVEEIFTELFRYHIRGIASEKGRDYLSQQFKKGEFTLY